MPTYSRKTGKRLPQLKESWSANRKWESLKDIEKCIVYNYYCNIKKDDKNQKKGGTNCKGWAIEQSGCAAHHSHFREIREYYSQDQFCSRGRKLAELALDLFIQDIKVHQPYVNGRPLIPEG